MMDYHHANFRADRCHRRRDICNWTDSKKDRKNYSSLNIRRITADLNQAKHILALRLSIAIALLSWKTAKRQLHGNKKQRTKMLPKSAPLDGLQLETSDDILGLLLISMLMHPSSTDFYDYCTF